MRVMVFFDLPVGTAKQRKTAAKFRKNLVKSGFLMMQESVYVKLAINDRAADSIIAKLEAERPSEGLVQALTVTEYQYSNIRCIAGKPAEHAELDDTDGLVIL
jgi:CRISPR-associated protein Cas2